MTCIDHQLFIADQIALDVGWDRVLPVVCATEEKCVGFPGFLRQAIVVAAASSAMIIAAKYVHAARDAGEL